MGILYGWAAAQDAEYRAHWERLAATTPSEDADDELLWIVLGDSAAVGVGAESVDRSYVAQVAETLTRRTGRPVRIVNLAISGATAATVLREQVPRLDALLSDGPGSAGRSPDVVTCVVGGNDITWTRRFRPEHFEADLDRVAAHLPAGSTLGLVPSFRLWPFEQRVRRANAVVRRIAARHGLGVADLHVATLRSSLRHQFGRLSPDWFHPNGAGYADWARALLPEVLRQVRGEPPTG